MPGTTAPHTERVVALFGRTHALALLDQARRDASAGSGRLVLVTGEAGIGKSTLAGRALDDVVADGFRVARGYAIDDPGAPAVWPWKRISRDLPEISDALAGPAADGPVPDAAARFRMCESISDELGAVAVDNGLAILIEDAQWADTATVAILKHLSLDLPSMRILLVVTARDTPGTPFDRARADLTRTAHSLSIPLTGLAPDAVREWLSTRDTAPGADAWLAHLPDLIHRTGGNPFYIRTLASQPSPEPEPGAIDRVIMDRSDLRSILVAPWHALGDDARDTVATAAVLAERLTPALLAGARQRPLHRVSEDLADAVRAGLLHFGSTGLAFSHAIVRDSIVTELTEDERCDAHARIARAMDDTADESLVGPAAAHWDMASGPDAARCCRDRARRAAVIAARDLAHDRAVEFARMTLRHSITLGERDVTLAEATLTLARYEWSAGMLPDALETCAGAIDLADSCDRPDLMAEAALVPQGIGSLDVSRVRAEWCRRVLDRLPEGESALRARLLGLLATAAADEAVDTSAAALSAQALKLARESGDPTAELEAIAARHFVLSYPQAIDERTALAARAVELADAAPMGRLWGLLWMADIALQRGDVVRWDTLTQDMERLAERTGSPVARWHVCRMRALRLAQTGEFASAVEYALSARHIAERVGDISMLGMFFAFMVQLALLRGRTDQIPDGALALMDQAPDIPLITVNRAQIHLALGHRGIAESIIAPLRDLPDRMPLGPRWSGSVGNLGMLAVDLGDTDLAHRCYRVTLPTARWFWADGGGAPYAAGSSELPLGHFARCAGDPDTALGHFRRALDADIRIGARPYAALARLGWAQCLVDLGRSPAQARDLARDALTEFEALDMPGPAGRARQLLERLGTGSSDGSGLTVRESEVAILVGQGLTNKDIAGRLFLSVRTVESHVRGALAKLQLTSRTELAVWVHRGPSG